jgi:hypothetical protein
MDEVQEVPNLNMPSKFLKDVLNPWLLGADPEWAIMQPPDQVVPNTGTNAVNTQKAAGAIGSDHGGRVWELRPAPSPSAYVVTLNIWKLLRQQELDKLEKFKWKSGALGAKKHAAQGLIAGPTTLAGWVQHYHGQGYSLQTAQQMGQAALQMQQQQQAALVNDLDTLGGHVHFGLQQFNAQQRRALDAVTTGMLNLDILPRKENERRLLISQLSPYKYGHFNGGDAVRDCNGHVEYRCAPSWLDRPLQALAALTTYKLAAARPSSVKWPEAHSLKADYLDWLDELAAVDVDAWNLGRFIECLGFEQTTADPAEDFKKRWRRENPFER